MGREGGDRGLMARRMIGLSGAEGARTRDGRLTAMFFRVTRDCSTRR